MLNLSELERALTPMPDLPAPNTEAFPMRTML